MAENCGKKWWAWQGLNLRPLRCQGRGLHQKTHKSPVFRKAQSRTGREQTRFFGQVYRAVTALAAPTTSNLAHDGKEW